MDGCGNRVKIAVSMGDPAGIGPELALKAALDSGLNRQCCFTLFGDAAVLERTAADCGLPLPDCEVRQVGEAGEYRMGEVQASCGRIARDSVAAAARAVIEGEFEALVTAPVNKYAVNLSGVEFSGHTEMIAGMCGVSDFAMMQSADDLRVAFVTTHIALGSVPQFVTVERIVKVACLLSEAVAAEKGGSYRPHLTMAALNPHAGEKGCMGTEDEEVTRPAAAMLRKEYGIDISDPFPPDTLFVPGTLEKFDGIVSMYHDQGHIPFKMLAFDRGVNSTLGLPVIRTSPDHGTAFEIAGRNMADTGSFFAAVRLAAKRALAKRSSRE